MKILHVITSLRTGGAEKLMVDLLPRLKEMGHQVDLCVFDGVKTAFYQDLENLGIKIYPLREGGSVYDLRNILALKRIMYRYDIVHTHNTAPQLYAAIANIFGSQILVTTEHNTTNRRRGKWYLKRGDQWMYRQYKKIICISDQARENLVKYIGDDPKIITIYNGIDVERFANAASLRTHDDDCKVITMVSAFRPQKDHKTLIKAFCLLPDNYRLYLVGDGELRKETELYAKQFSCADRIDFLGNRKDIPAILKGSDVVVLSSHYEGLSLSSIEGMASGKPFIASDVEGLHEIVNGYGELFPHEDANALAKAIKDLCENKEYARKISAQCQNRARQYDISQMAEKYNQVYLQIKQ